MTKSSNTKVQSETITLSEAQWDLISKHLGFAQNWASVGKFANGAEAYRLKKTIECLKKQRSAVS